MNGKCIDYINSFECECFDGFSGEFCETDFNECDSNPCDPYGKCVMDVVGTYFCKCPFGATSSSLELQLCDVDIECVRNFIKFTKIVKKFSNIVDNFFNRNQT